MLVFRKLSLPSSLTVILQGEQADFPDKEGQMYYCEKDDLYLIPTAEVPVTNLYRDALVSVDENCPLK